jgi:5-methylcytosine-specific restriction enzyme subunit McrC
VAALLKDELRFHQLFEDFIRNFYKIHLTSHRVQREVLSWGESPSNSLVPQMRTDTTVVERIPPYSRMIIDTKYSIRTLTDRKKFKSENLYQIYAYLRTQEGRGPAFAEAQAMLMYPTTETDVDSTMSVQGHSIRVVTVNLARGWQEIEAQLLALIPPRLIAN